MSTPPPGIIHRRSFRDVLQCRGNPIGCEAPAAFRHMEQSSAWATPGAPASLPAKAQLPRAGRDAGAPGTYPVEPVCCSLSRRFVSMAIECEIYADANRKRQSWIPRQPHLPRPMPYRCFSPRIKSCCCDTAIEAWHFSSNGFLATTLNWAPASKTVVSPFSERK